MKKNRPADLHRFTLLPALLLAVLLSFPVFSAEDSAEIGFYCMPLFPENQREGRGYFDLEVGPGLEQELSVRVVNTEKETIRVEARLTDAATNPNGEIDYSGDASLSTNAPHPFTSISSIDEPVVSIPPGESREITFRLQLPEESFDGVILGGVCVLRLPEEDENASAIETVGQKATTGIINRYQYAYAVVLSQSETEATPSFSLGDVSAKIMNSQPAVVMELSNESPILIKDLHIKTDLFLEGERKPVLSWSTERYSMAPNSLLELPLFSENRQGFPAGDYRVTVEIGFQDEKWNFEENFAITQELSKRMNETAEYPPVIRSQQEKPERSAGSSFPWIFLCLALPLMGALLFLAIKVRKSNREYEKFVSEKMQRS